MNHLKELLFKKTQELKVQKDKEKCVLAEIAGGRTSLKNLKSRLHRLDAEALRQQEHIYNQVKYEALSYCDFGCNESKLLEFCNLCQHFGNAMQYNLKSAFISVSGCMDKIEITEACYSITYVMHLCISLFFWICCFPH